MTSLSDSADRVKMVGYKRSESVQEPPRNKSLLDLRSRFELSENFPTPEFGIAFGAKKAAVLKDISKTQKGKQISNEVQLSQSSDSLLNMDQPQAEKKQEEHKTSKLLIDDDHKVLSRDKLRLGTITPRGVSSGFISKQTSPDKESPLNTMNTMINSDNMPLTSANQETQSPTSAPLNLSKIGFNRVKSSETDAEKCGLSSSLDYIYTSKIDSKLLGAKTFWNKRNQDPDSVRPLSADLGTDFSVKNTGKTAASATKQVDERSNGLCAKTKTDKNANFEESKQNDKMSTSLIEDTKLCRSEPLSKSSSQNSISNSMDGSDQEYVNAKVIRRTATKPPQNIVARRTQLFEKQPDELTAEESEAYRKMKEIGTVFRPKETESSHATVLSPKLKKQTERLSAEITSRDGDPEPASKDSGTVTKIKELETMVHSVKSSKSNEASVIDGASHQKKNSSTTTNGIPKPTKSLETTALGGNIEKIEGNRKSQEFGLVFRPKDSTDSVPSTANVRQSKLVDTTEAKAANKPKPATKPEILVNYSTVSKSKTINENVSKEVPKSAKNSSLVTDKPVDMFENFTYETSKLGKGKLDEVSQKPKKEVSKPVVAKKFRVKDKGQEMFNQKAAANSNDTEVKSPQLPKKFKQQECSPPLPPPKPPRTYQYRLTRSTSAESLLRENNFDPIIIPRQDGDGQESERELTCLTSQQTADILIDNRLYTRAMPYEPRPYTSLINEGSGDDSVCGSENAYDTLGRSSVASSYDHYDTISQSELDSDISRPPTLPRRPSILKHIRPMTTAFGNLDIMKSNSHEKALTSSMQSTIKEVSPTSPSPTKSKGPFKLKYLLPKTKRKSEDMRKAASVACLAADSLYDTVEILPPGVLLNKNSDEIHIDSLGYAVPEFKGHKKIADSKSSSLDHLTNKLDKNHEKIRLKLNQAFSALRKPTAPSATHISDGEDEEKAPDPEVLEERLKHCNTVKENAIYANVEQIKGFMTKTYAQLFDYAVIVSLRKNPDSNIYEPFVKFKFPPQVSVENTTVPQFCFPDAHIWHKVTEYRSEAFSFVLTDVTGNRQYGYCRRILPTDVNNLPRVAEVICVVSPLNANKFYSQLLDEVEKRRMQNALRAEEFLQAVYGRPMPSPGQSACIKAMNVNEDPETLVFTRSPDAQREGIEHESLLNSLTISQIIKIFASMLLERKIIFIAEKLSALSQCVHAFISLLYPFSWQHTFIPLLPPNLIDVVCAPTPYIVGILSSNYQLLTTLDDEMEEVLIVDLDNHKFLQRKGDEKTILPKKLHRALMTSLEMAKSESGAQRNLMVSEAFLRFFLETCGSFNDFMIHVPGEGRQFQKEEFVSSAANVPNIMVFLQWFTETQMFEVYMTERENDKNVISGTFEERVFEFKSENHEEFHNDNKKFKKFKLFGKKGKR